jgi:dihydrodipicolinate synthase/N-acetylneuraminate lyase
MKISDIDSVVLGKFRKGTVIPAMPLALTEKREFDQPAQEVLTRYYMDAGAGGIAVGVHSTQFAIREYGLFEKVLSCVSETADRWSQKTGNAVFKISGACGKTTQAVGEAGFALKAGYHAAMLSLVAMKDAGLSAMLDHCAKVADVMPLIGFYLQSAVGGPELPYQFWKEFMKIPNVVGIKIAPFNRYKTFDVIRALCEAGKENEITLYTGNDDTIVTDLLTEYQIRVNGTNKKVRIKGGLLGHWCVWTQKAVMLLDEIHALVENDKDIPAKLLTKGMEITDCNAVFFDAAHNFAGCIPGIHEVLRRQGLLKGTWCLDPNEVLSPEQNDEISRIHKAYPHLNDDNFVKEKMYSWTS